MSALNNDERLRMIAAALDDLNEEVVFVGGAVIQLYSSDVAAISPMTTFDVDCVVNVTSYAQFRAFEQKLFEKNFSNDTSEGAPICRYLFEGEKVDFMPKVDTPIGESNRWYFKGMELRRIYHLDDTHTIFIMPVSYYLASKIEALHSRGGEDYRGAKDFEDIVYVLNTCESLMEDVRLTVNTQVSDYLQSEFAAMVKRPNIREEIESALTEQGRMEIVLKRMKDIALAEQ